MSIDRADFDYVRRLVREHAAVVLEADKAYLAELRLVPLARQEGVDSISALVKRMRRQSFNRLHERAVEALVTTETSFFRDHHPFEALRVSVLPDLLKQRTRENPLTIWCAACARGQEPYSIALLLREYFRESADVRLIASDLSEEMLAAARAGRYSQLEIDRGLPPALLKSYFRKQGATWQIDETLRRMVEFRKINLAAAWPPLPEMDVIFMRNVLIYFDVETKKTILDRVHRLLRPDGYLFFGNAETTINLDDRFERVDYGKASCYRLREQPARADRRAPFQHPGADEDAPPRSTTPHKQKARSV